MVKAASIAYAVFMAALTALFCYGLVLVFSLNTNLEDHYDSRLALVQDRFSALAYGQAVFGELEEGQWKAGPGIQQGISHRLRKDRWGLLWVLTTQSVRQNDSLQQQYLVAPGFDPKHATFYLRDNDEPLKLSGVTTLEGLVKCGSKQLSKKRISGSEDFQITQNGTVARSAKILPDIDLPELNPDLEFENLALTEAIEPITIPFGEKPMVLAAGRTLENLSINGQVLIQSQDTLTVKATALLKDVLVQAPKVIIEKGFKGSLQIIATKEIELQEDVILDYPSVLLINSTGQDKTQISIAENCQINGAIVVPGQGLAQEQDHLLQIGKDSQVQGQIYCGGILELYADVRGQITTSALLYKTNATRYTNLLNDVKITKPKHHKWLFGLENRPEIPFVILKKV